MFNIVKQDLTLPVDFGVDPKDCYVRIGKVLTVSLRSRDLTIQFVDGDRDEDNNLEFFEEPVVATSVIGSLERETTYVPSAVVYGKGDLVSVLCLRNATYLAVSPLDMNEQLNRQTYPTLKDWALFDVLNGINVAGVHDGVTPEDSYLTFWDPLTHITTRITGNPDNNKLFLQMLEHWIWERTQALPITRNEGLWYYDINRSGPDNNYEKRIDGNMHKGRYVNGFPYVEYEGFFNDVATVKNEMTAFHPTITGLQEGKVHPLAGVLEFPRYFDTAAVVWFDDPDPTHVLVIGSHPAWDGAKNIMFLEVPVYSLAGRKKLEEEITDEDLETEERKTVQTFQDYGDQIRLIRIIPRNYVDWSAHESDVEFSERLHKSINVYLPRFTGESTTYGILDGYGWGQSGTVMSINKLQKFTGTIERSIVEPDVETYANGSRYAYEITNSSPILGNVNLFHHVRFIYEWNDGAEWESQEVMDPSVEYPCYIDGNTDMHRQISLNYYCDGHYNHDVMITGLIAWSDGQNGGVANVQDIINDCTHTTYRNGILRWTEEFHFRKTSVGGMWGWGTQISLNYSDVDYDLYIYEKTVTDIDEGSCFLGPAYACTGIQTHYGIVLFQGIEYIIWEYVITLEVMPTLWNFWPWIINSADPERPETPPYSQNIDYNNPYWHWPHFSGTIGTLVNGYSSVGMGAPGPLFSPESLPHHQVVCMYRDDWKDDMLRVHIDKETDSFCIKFQCYMRSTTNKVLTYPNVGYTIMRFNGGSLHFNIPVDTVTIDL